MSIRRKRDDRSKSPLPRGQIGQQPAGAAWERGLLALVTCLLVVTPLIPSESAVKEGTAALLVALWLMTLALWAGWLVVSPSRQVIAGWTMIAVTAFLVLHTLSAMVAGRQGNGRQALNVLWLFIAYGTAAFLLRQLVHSKAECRALIAVMIGLAAVESASGYYQYFVSGPERRAAFQKDPESMYRQIGASTPTTRDQFRWRIESVEPLGTFALTNSLAGLLVPWLIALAGITLALLQQGRWRSLALATLALAAIAGCLLLTKSRTALLAAGGGAVLLFLCGRNRGWRLDWRIPALAGAAIVVLALIAVAVGGLDAQVLSQAPQSVLYRLQYWQSTAAMIADHPLFGCGPGNFKEHYARYQLPQASETVSDPHNFLLEIWATAGTPALLALLAVALVFGWELSRARPETSSRPLPTEAAGSRGWIYSGALAGVLLAYPLALVANFPLEPLSLGGKPLMLVIWPPDIKVPVLVVWALGLPAAVLVIWLLDEWVVRGELPTAVPVISLVVLLANLLAAGAATFPGVFGFAWLLVPVALVHADAAAWRWSLPRGGAVAALLLSLLLGAACIYTEYFPVLRAGVGLEGARRLAAEGHLAEADQTLLLAAANDPWSPEPWRELGDLRLQVWRQSNETADWERFVEAADQFLHRDSQHFQAFENRGHWYLAAWRASGRPADLTTALEAYRQAAKLHPSRAGQHAQLAWALHLAGQEPAARSEAETALRLDGLNPHSEQKLAKQAIFDPRGEASGQTVFRLDNAEQTMGELRKSSGREDQP